MVRQAIFNLLGQDLTGERALDVCCGSGALGLEALSRGAAHAWLVDLSGRVTQVARENAADLGLSHQVTVVTGDARDQLLALPAGQATLALVDPPYAMRDRSGLAAALAHALAPGSKVVLETAAQEGDVVLGPSFESTGRRVYGDTAVHLLRRLAP
jgi:16S rRNA (guanine966-N2)-methyltransferase